MPEGADTIAIQENVRAVDGATIEVFETVAAGRHIRAVGLDFTKGDMLLDEGRVLDAAAVSLAASANHISLDVVRRPLVAIIATGDELLPPGSTPGPDQIIASNGYGVAAIARAAGATVIDLGIARDDAASIGTLIDRAVQAGADVIVTLGGASVGDHDLVHDVLTAHGMTLDFWKIAMRPGKPLMFGRLGSVRCIGLPGNPVASLVCSHLFLKPLVARLAGLPHRHDLRQARLAVQMAENDQRQDYVRATLRETGDGLEATPCRSGFFDASDIVRSKRPHSPRALRPGLCSRRDLHGFDAALTMRTLSVAREPRQSAPCRKGLALKRRDAALGLRTSRRRTAAHAAIALKRASLKARGQIFCSG